MSSLEHWKPPCIHIQPYIVHKTFYPDETWFHLNGYSNSKKVTIRILKIHLPLWHIQQYILHRWRMILLFGYINSKKVITGALKTIMYPLHSLHLYIVKRQGMVHALLQLYYWSHFFINNSNSVFYHEILYQFIALFEVNERYCWFQQDGATYHAANKTMAIF